MNSLPLMGIVNEGGGVARIGLHDDLITPHGDRKPVMTVYNIVLTQHLITPHGDRKPGARKRSHRQRRATHYPSSGS